MWILYKIALLEAKHNHAAIRRIKKKRSYKRCELIRKEEKLSQSVAELTICYIKHQCHKSEFPHLHTKFYHSAYRKKTKKEDVKIINIVIFVHAFTTTFISGTVLHANEEIEG